MIILSIQQSGIIPDWKLELQPSFAHYLEE